MEARSPKEPAAPVVGAGLALIAMAFAVYGKTTGFDFIGVDDPLYILDNYFVFTGLTTENALWALTSTQRVNWHPTTWISHMIDVELYGLEPWGHHLTNVVFHAANGVLLFELLRRGTDRLMESAVVAALFVVHPLHVESVAWVSERKDVLSTFFWLAATLGYLRYAAQPGIGRYLATTVLFVGGLLAKPMVVTWPCTLVLLDYWPLARFGWAPRNGAPRAAQRSTTTLLLEKLPWLAFAIGTSAITMVAQRPGADFTAERLPVTARIGNAGLSYIEYLWRTVWPTDLAIFYPHPGAPELWPALLAAAVLVLVTGLALLRPATAVGWLWFIGTLVPVIGLVQVGGQAFADRYTYVPHIGLFVALVFPLGAAARRAGTAAPAAAAAAIVATLGVVAFQQVDHWRNSETLFRHAVAVTEDNWFAHSALGEALLSQGRVAEAEIHLQHAVRINPAEFVSLSNLGAIHLNRGELDAAQAMLLRAIEHRPYDPIALLNLGIIAETAGNLDDAENRYRSAIRGDPVDTRARLRLAHLRHRRKRFPGAIQQYQRVLRLDPDHTAAQRGLALAKRREPLADERP